MRGPSVPSTQIPPLPGTAPAAAAPTDQPSASDAYTDPFSTLGARSPFCSLAVGPAARSDCRRSGSIAHPYPLSSYGIDSQVRMGPTNFADNVLGALQDVAAFVWLALVYLMKGVLLLLEWAFSLDLLNHGMSAVRNALATLHRDVLGRPWFLAAIAAAGVWGTWRGLVQRRATETITGLAATVGLMLVALVLITDPQGTVGQGSRAADDASLAVMSTTANGTFGAPQASFAAALEGLFDTTILRPWAALEFGDVAWATRPVEAGSRLTNADLWLAYPAGSDQRASLYARQGGQTSSGVLGDVLSFVKRLPGADLAVLGSGGHELPATVTRYVHKDASKVRLQQAGGTLPRLALLALISVGLIGAVLLFLYVGVRLMLASIMTLLLLLLAPAMLLAPALGASGRATTASWARRLAAATAAKLVYSLLLAVLLIGSSVVESLHLGWIATWLVQLAYWWGVLLKRHELLGFVSAGRIADSSRGGSRFHQARYGLRATGTLLAGTLALAGLRRRRGSPRRSPTQPERLPDVFLPRRGRRGGAGMHALEPPHAAAHAPAAGTAEGFHHDAAARPERARAGALPAVAAGVTSPRADEVVAPTDARPADANTPVRRATTPHAAESHDRSALVQQHGAASQPERRAAPALRSPHVVQLARSAEGHRALGRDRATTESARGGVQAVPSPQRPGNRDRPARREVPPPHGAAAQRRADQPTAGADDASSARRSAGARSPTPAQRERPSTQPVVLAERSPAETSTERPSRASARPVEAARRPPGGREARRSAAVPPPLAGPREIDYRDHIERARDRLTRSRAARAASDAERA